MMKKILMMNIIVGCLLLFNSCGVWDMIGAGGVNSIKQYSIHGINQKNLEILVTNLLKRNILYANIDRAYQIQRKNSNANKQLGIDSLYLLEKGQCFLVRYHGFKEFRCYLEIKKLFYEIVVGNYQGKLIGCDLFITNIFRDNIDDYSNMSKQEQQEAIKAFEREILPLIKRNVMRMKQEQ